MVMVSISLRNFCQLATAMNFGISLSLLGQYTWHVVPSNKSLVTSSFLNPIESFDLPIFFQICLASFHTSSTISISIDTILLDAIYVSIKFINSLYLYPMRKKFPLMTFFIVSTIFSRISRLERQGFEYSFRAGSIIPTFDLLLPQFLHSWDWVGTRDHVVNAEGGFRSVLRSTRSIFDCSTRCWYIFEMENEALLYLYI